MSGNGSTQSPQGEFASIARELGRGALVTVMRGPSHGARMLVRMDGTTAGSLGDAELERVAAARADELMWAERFTATTIAIATLSPRAVQASTSVRTSLT